MNTNFSTLFKPKKPFLKLFLSSISILALGVVRPIYAQVVEDKTLSTTVTTNDNRNFVINNGQQVGDNLFHSFKEFSVPTNGSANFNNLPTIKNIISRVTGLSSSKIDGIIQNNGTANLFLINPNGIIFGTNAVLNLGGSFIATTAESLIFEDGKEFSTKDTNLQSLLTIRTPIGLQFGKNSASITNQSQLIIAAPSDTTGESKVNIGLSVPPENTLALIGGDIVIDGGAVTAPGGNIELGSVAADSFVALNSDVKGWELAYPEKTQFQDIVLDNLAAVDASSEGGGDIDVRGRKIQILNGSAIVSDTTGSKNGGAISINADQSLEIIGSDLTEQNLEPFFATIGIFVPAPSRLSANTFSAGNAGNIFITTEKLSITDGAQIQAVTVPDRLNPDRSLGEGGNISIAAEKLIRLQGVKPLLGVADNASKLLPLSTDGDISTNLNRFIEIGRSSRIDASSSNNGRSGNINIITNQLKLQDGAVIQNIPFARGSGGDINISAAESIEIAGNSERNGSVGSIIAANAFGLGDAGNIELTTGKLSLLEGGGISTSTLTTAEGGDITLNATEIEILGTSGNGELKSGLGSETFGAGKAGNLLVNTDKLTIADGGQITVRGTGSGSPGNLEIKANSLDLSDRAMITAATASGAGGNIKLQLQDNLTLRKNSIISAQAAGNANGGNIDIEANFILAVPGENSDILAKAVRGNGGNINIITQGIFNLTERSSEPANTTNDIDASSQFGLAGSVRINLPQISFAPEFFNSSAGIVDVNYLLKNSFCRLSKNSSYIATGRGGIPVVPENDLSTEDTWEDWRILAEAEVGGVGSVEEVREVEEVQEIEPIQGWVRNRQGKVVLTAQALVVTPHTPATNALSCN